MAHLCSVQDYFKLHRDTPIIDVRSPSEYAIGHVPGRFNIPLLDDQQRAEVGTCYKQKGKYEAIELGFELIGPQLIQMIRQAKKIAHQNKLAIYCWRGGMRSNNMAWLLETNGLECQVLEGGYKAFRKYGKSLFDSSDYRTIVLGGYTGSNKTKVLYELSSCGEQVLDIEEIARHRGSSFGRIGLEPQLPNEQFENQLIWEWMEFDPSRRIWIEDESKILGSNHLPEPLYNLIRNSMVFNIKIDKIQRAKNLVEVYGGLDDSELENAIIRIKRKLGGQNLNLALEALHDKDYQKVAEISLDYYDKTYAFGLSKRKKETVRLLHPNTNHPTQIALQLIEEAQKYE